MATADCTVATAHRPRYALSLALRMSTLAADAIHHELISHIAGTHIFIEPFVVATKRVLPAKHPLAVLLQPHFEGTLCVCASACRLMQ